jgi:rubrerythrin
MDSLLIILIFAIVITVGYILSRPFIRTDAAQDNPTAITDCQTRMNNLKEEITLLDSECNEGAPHVDAYKALEEKKEQAADLFQLNQVPANEDNSTSQSNQEIEEHNTQSKDSFTQEESSHFCPKCGHLVMSSDKFCMHCGYRLHP